MENGLIKGAIIGAGNCGGQIAALGVNAGIPAIAMNTSDKDLSQLDNVTKLTIGQFKGAGKDRAFAKKSFKPVAADIINHDKLVEVVKDAEVIFVAGATNGGTGSALVPIIAATMNKLFPGKVVVAIGVVGSKTESVIAQQNGIDFIQDLEKVKVPYMLYDNDLAESKLTMYDDVNNKVISDIKTILGYNIESTPLDSIDERDLKNLLSTPGRMVAGSVVLKERDVNRAEALLVENTKLLTVPLNEDKVITKMGLIITGDKGFIEGFSKNEINDAFGDEMKDFNNITETERVRLVEVILTGLSAPISRIDGMIRKVNEFTSKDRVGFGTALSNKTTDIKRIVADADLDIEADNTIVADPIDEKSDNNEGVGFDLNSILDIFDED